MFVHPTPHPRRLELVPAQSMPTYVCRHGAVMPSPAADVLTGRAPPGAPFGDAGEPQQPPPPAPPPAALTDASPSAPSIMFGKRAEQLQAAREAALEAVKSEAMVEAAATAVAEGPAASATPTEGAPSNNAATAGVAQADAAARTKDVTADAASAASAAAAEASKDDNDKGSKGIITRENMYELNRLQSAMTELLNSGNKIPLQF